MFIFNRKIAAILGLTLIVSVLCGCDSKTEEYSEETEKVVAEYAAGLLLKYDKNHVSGLTKLPEDETMKIASEENVKEVVSEETIEQQMTEPERIEIEGGAIEDGKDNLSDDSAVNISIADALGANGFDISYTGYELCDSYPNEQEDLYFSLNAEKGNKLLVLNFSVRNVSDEDLELNTLYNTTRARLVIDDTDTINQQMTMLTNDLKSYEQVFKAGEEMNSVLVFEINGDTEITSMDLLLINDQENRYKLM